MVDFKNDITPYAVGRRINAEEWNGISRILQGDVTVSFGEPVISHSANRGCAPLTAAAQNVLGITEANVVMPHVGDYYKKYDTVGICEVGVIGAKITEPVVKGAQARWDVTNKGWTDAAASATVLTIPGATFETEGTAANQVVAIRYRRPNPSLSA